MDDQVSSLTPIDHIAINVADVEKSATWYQSSFACEVISIDKRLAILRFQNIYLHLVLPSQEPGHLSFTRPDAHSYGEMRQRSDGVLSTYVADPTGNFIEVIASPTAQVMSGEAKT